MNMAEILPDLTEFLVGAEKKISKTQVNRYDNDT